MKAHLIFDTSDPDDRQEYMRCVKSFDMAQAIWDILQLKKKLEHEFESETLTVFDGIDAFAEGIKEILEDNNINIDELTS